MVEAKLNCNDFVDIYNVSYELAVTDLIKRNGLENVDLVSILKNANSTLVYAKLYIRKIVDQYRERGFDKKVCALYVLILVDLRSLVH